MTVQTEKKHTFAVCAYKESPFLETCIRSLKRQTVPTNIIVVTSTPNDHISKIADKYDIGVYVNEGESGITQDWNYAYQKAETPYVTIAHQDDVYHSQYCEYLFRYTETSNKPLIFFTDYGEIRNGKIVTSNRLLRIKRIMLSPLLIRSFGKSIFIRRRILSLGSPICCPSVTFIKPYLPGFAFENHFRADEDWEAWEKISRFDGDFVFCPKPLMLHRIHEDSETSKILEENRRGREDFIMFQKFWPSRIAALLTNLYGRSEKSNQL